MADLPARGKEGTDPGMFGRLPKVFGSRSKDPARRPVVEDDEVFALLEYAAREGVSRQKLEALSAEIHSEQRDLSLIGGLYADLVAETKPVNGRTLIDSTEEGVTRLWGIGTATVVFFALAVGNGIADRWIADLIEPEEGALFFDIKRYAWDYLTPFFWGGLGSCIFLLKRVQDLASAHVYEHDQLQGWFARVLLGGILGAVVESIFNLAAISSGPLPLGSNALAFLTGVGVKVVYGAIERLIESLSDRLRIDTLKLVKGAPQQPPPAKPETSPAEHQPPQAPR